MLKTNTTVSLISITSPEVPTAGFELFFFSKMVVIYLSLLSTLRQVVWYRKQLHIDIEKGTFVAVSSVSFLIPPTAYPARCGLLLTTLLVGVLFDFRSSRSFSRC